MHVLEPRFCQVWQKEYIPTLIFVNISAIALEFLKEIFTVVFGVPIYTDLASFVWLSHLNQASDKNSATSNITTL